MDSLLNPSTLALTEFSAAVIVFNILLTFALSVAIAWVYRKTHRGLSYSQSFVTALVMMSILATIAMMILGNNLVRALGVLGIFALIRFRTIVKDTKDITYLFFALAIGMAVGTSNYVIAFIGTVMLSAILLLLSRYNFGSAIRYDFLLTFVVDERFNDGAYRQLFDENFSLYELMQIKSQPNGEREYYFTVCFRKDDNKERVIHQLKALDGVKIIDLITGKESIEY